MNQLQRVLDALEDAGYHGSVIATVKQMMQAEPVAWELFFNNGNSNGFTTDKGEAAEFGENKRPLYAEPQAVPVRKPLTHEQIQSAYTRAYNGGDHGRDFENAFCREIEKAHGIV